MVTSRQPRGSLHVATASATGRAEAGAWTAAALALLTLVAGLATITTAADAKRDHRKRMPLLTVRITDSVQRAIVKKERIRVRVRARHRGRVRVYVVIAPRRRGTAAIVLTRPVTVRVKAHRWRTVTLRVVTAGRSALAGCGDGRDLQARAHLLHGSRRVPGRKFKSPRRRLRLSHPFCSRTGAGGRGTAAHRITYDASNADSS